MPDPTPSHPESEHTPDRRQHQTVCATFSKEGTHYSPSREEFWRAMRVAEQRLPRSPTPAVKNVPGKLLRRKPR